MTDRTSPSANALLADRLAAIRPCDDGNRKEALRALREAVAALRSVASEKALSDEPYGYVWFNKHMEQRFTRSLPRPGSSEQPIGDITKVYAAPPGEAVRSQKVGDDSVIPAGAAPVAWAVVHSDGDPREANSIHWPATCRHTAGGDPKAAAQAWADRFGYSIVPLYAPSWEAK